MTIGHAEKRTFFFTRPLALDFPTELPINNNTGHEVEMHASNDCGTGRRETVNSP